MFKSWSESNPLVKEKISPSLGLREWNDLSDREKSLIFFHFAKNGWMQECDNNLTATIYFINDTYKKENYCPKTLLEIVAKGIRPRDFNDIPISLHTAAHTDFINIWTTQSQDIVYEIISQYALNISEDFDQGKFSRFCDCFNDIAESFSLDIMITRGGLVPRQSKQIIQKIYNPVFDYLSATKWEAVSNEVREAFSDFRKKDYDDCIVKLSNSIQGYLQIIVNNEIGKGDIGKLIPEARKQKLIPSDTYTYEFLKTISNYLARERKDKSGAHPKRSTATEGDAMFLIDLVMVVLKHWLQVQ